MSTALGGLGERNGTGMSLVVFVVDRKVKNEILRNCLDCRTSSDGEVCCM